uniref:Chromosome 9 C22orf23 homolog n=1 Tax=Cynoglossus semilaevis TaxID=244447 RepID=A0A3P8VT87_CYNSE
MLRFTPSVMMQESRLTNLQRRQINDYGAALPLASDLRSPPQAPQSKPSERVQRELLGKPLRRSAESCRSGNSYVREKFCPGPKKDLEKEKRRLQSLMATGQEEPTVSSNANVPAKVTEEKDRFQEVLDEIEERRQFLADMASLGQEKKYIHIITAEISQKIRELEVLEKTCHKDQEEERKRGAD